MRVAPVHLARRARIILSALAMEAASEAVKSCEASGYRVSMAIVDTQGVTQLLATGDQSTLHTKESSFRKAYTVVTMAAIGVGGAPGGEKDEVCAQAGRAKIGDHLPK